MESNDTSSTITASKSIEDQVADQPDPSEWLELYGNVLLQQAILRVKRREVAEEMVQETLLAAYRNLDSFEGRSSVKTWLISILRNKCIDYIRKASREDVTDLSEPGEGEGAKYFNKYGIWSRWLPRWEENPEDLLERKKMMAVLRGCLEKLPERLQTVMTLKVIEEQSTEKICQELDITSSNLWVIVYRARMQLRECLEKNYYSPPGNSTAGKS